MKIREIDNYKITFDVENDFKTNKLIEGVATNNKNISWVPITYEKVRELTEVFPTDKQLQTLLDKLDEELFMSQFPTFFCLDENLRQYQREVVDKINDKGSFGLFMEQRTGKTPTSVVAMKELSVKKIIVSVPNGLQTSWKNSFEKFGNRTDVRLLKGGPDARADIYSKFAKEESGILIGSYDTFSRDALNDMINFNVDYLILDEAHFLRNNTQRSKGAHKLRKHASHALALTGTPATSKAEDVIPILIFLHPKSFSKWGLIEYFFDSMRGRFATEIIGIKKNRQVEWAQLLNRFSVIIKQKDVMHWIPKIEKIDVVIDMEDKQRSAFKKMLNEFRLENHNGTITMRAENHLVQMGKLIQLGLDPRILNVNYDGAKTKWIKEWVSENSTEPVIIWSNSKAYLDLLKEELKEHSPLMMTGDVKKEDRQPIVDSFQRGDSNVILLKIGVGSMGYTLDRATTMVYMDRDWSVIMNDQSDSRFIPTQEVVSENPLTIIDLMCENSMDELVRNANENKWDRIQIVNNFKEWLK